MRPSENLLAGAMALLVVGGVSLFIYHDQREGREIERMERKVADSEAFLARRDQLFRANWERKNPGRVFGHLYKPIVAKHRAISQTGKFEGSLHGGALLLGGTGGGTVRGESTGSFKGGTIFLLEAADHTLIEVSQATFIATKKGSIFHAAPSRWQHPEAQ